jgi:hypothetical protein
MCVVINNAIHERDYSAALEFLRQLNSLCKFYLACFNSDDWEWNLMYLNSFVWASRLEIVQGEHPAENASELTQISKSLGHSRFFYNSHPFQKRSDDGLHVPLDSSKYDEDLKRKHRPLIEIACEWAKEKHEKEENVCKQKEEEQKDTFFSCVPPDVSVRSVRSFLKQLDDRNVHHLRGPSLSLLQLDKTLLKDALFKSKNTALSSRNDRVFKISDTSFSQHDVYEILTRKWYELRGLEKGGGEKNDEEKGKGDKLLGYETVSELLNEFGDDLLNYVDHFGTKPCCIDDIIQYFKFFLDCVDVVRSEPTLLLSFRSNLQNRLRNAESNVEALNKLAEGIAQGTETWNDSEFVRHYNCVLVLNLLLDLLPQNLDVLGEGSPSSVGATDGKTEPSLPLLAESSLSSSELSSPPQESSSSSSSLSSPSDVSTFLLSAFHQSQDHFNNLNQRLSSSSQPPSSLTGARGVPQGARLKMELHSPPENLMSSYALASGVAMVWWRDAMKLGYYSYPDELNVLVTDGKKKTRSDLSASLSLISSAISFLSQCVLTDKVANYQPRLQLLSLYNTLYAASAAQGLSAFNSSSNASTFTSTHIIPVAYGPVASFANIFAGKSNILYTFYDRLSVKHNQQLSLLNLIVWPLFRAFDFPGLKYAIARAQDFYREYLREGYFHIVCC